jgi:hypothetical protein
MARYRKKPVVVEAEQFWPDRLPFRDEGACCYDGFWYVITSHGQKTCIAPGDWFIREPDDRGFYPCKPDIFDATYEPA